MLSKQQLVGLLKREGHQPFRAKQLLHAIYREGKSDYESISVLPRNLVKFLTHHAPLFSFSITREVVSHTGDTVKTLFKLKDGKLVEGVLMKFRDGRNSVCVSSQVGCGLRCAFCATGTMGFIRNLTAEEIADQVLYFDQWLKKDERKRGPPQSHPAQRVAEQGERRVNHVIFMGMGEPMLNYDEVMKAIHTLNDPDCLGIAARHITISTSGVIPGIEKLSKEKLQINLAVSLHAPEQALREKFMPIAKAYKLNQLMKALDEYSARTRRRVSYEYVMLHGVNDSPACAEKLAKLLRGKRCHVNLIPYNETYLGFKNAGKSRIDRFRDIVASKKIPVTVRVSLGQDISAACGQLALKKEPLQPE